MTDGGRDNDKVCEIAESWMSHEASRTTSDSRAW